MKGLVLAGGTATRLFPLTIVTNKHLLPIYDRPMIYYPIETLAGMGIREVMVVVGGKSVGDVVELLADGSPLRARPDVPLPARRARHRPRDRPRPRLRRRRRVLRASSATTSCAGRTSRTSRASSRPGPCGAGTLLYRVPDPERFGVAELDADGNVVGFEEKPQHPKSDLIPIGVYFLRPDAFDVIDHLAPSGRGEFEITDVLNHYIPDGRLFTPRLRGPLDRRRDRAVAAARGRARPRRRRGRTPLRATGSSGRRTADDRPRPVGDGAT